MKKIAAPFQIGIDHIDDAHQHLYSLLSRIRELYYDNSLLADEKNKKTRYILNRLLDYTVTHFVEEEYLMELYRSPGRHAHKRAHRKMEKLMIDQYRSFQKEGIAILPQLMEIVGNWWNHHILTLDQVDLESVPHNEPAVETSSVTSLETPA